MDKNKRFEVKLSEEFYTCLLKCANDTGVSMSDIVRKALSDYLYAKGFYKRRKVF